MGDARWSWVRVGARACVYVEGGGAGIIQLWPFGQFNNPEQSCQEGKLNLMSACAKYTVDVNRWWLSFRHDGQICRQERAASMAPS